MQPCPDELLKNQRFAFIKGHPSCSARRTSSTSTARAARGSATAAALATVVDDIAIVRSMHTDQFNHAPAELSCTPAPRSGGAAMGSWITYGFGSENQNLPGFVVLISGGTDPTGGKALWGTGFLPSVYQGVQCRTAGRPDPLRLQSPGHGPRRPPPHARRPQQAQRAGARQIGDPETLTRISQYELAYPHADCRCPS